MKNKLASLALAATSVALSATSHAGILEIPEVTTLTGVNGLVNIGEFTDPFNDFSGFHVGYLVDVLSTDVSLTGFAVSSNSAFAKAGTNRDGWLPFPQLADPLTPTAWDIQYGFLGSFADLFGTDRFVNVFLLDPFDDGALPITESTDQDAGALLEETQFGLIHANGDSDFVAFNGNTVVDQSSSIAASVPDGGSTLLMLGAALTGLGLVQKMRRS